MTAMPEPWIVVMKRRKAEQQASERPPLGVEVEPAPDDPLWNARAARYCSRALDRMAARLSEWHEGERNHTLNSYALQCYRWHLAGHLDSDAITQELRNAAYTAGLASDEIEATLRSAWRGAQRYGPKQPRLSQSDPEAVFAVLDMETGEVRDARGSGEAAQSESTGREGEPSRSADLDGPDRHPGAEPDIGPAGVPQGDATPGTTDVAPTPEEAAKARYDSHVRLALFEIQVREAAKKLHDDEKATREFREPPSRPTLRDELAIPDEPIRFTVSELLPAGGNATLTAQYKTGKTTLIGELARAWADDEPFLGRFTVARSRPDARLGIFNYELSEQQYRIWLRELGIVNLDAVSVLHLRGYRLPLTAARIQDWVVGWLKEHDIALWVPDPFARAASGIEENSNAEVGQWLETLDVVKELAGVSEAVLPVHTGRAAQDSGQERARGATRLDDWADVRWLLTRDDEGVRYFRATGRDVEFEEEALSYEPLSRRLTISGGDRKWKAKRRAEEEVHAFIAANPGCSYSEAEACGGKKAANAAAIKTLQASGHVRAEIQDSRTGRKGFWITGKSLQM